MDSLWTSIFLCAMNCYNCIETQLTWGGDHDADPIADYDMVTNLSCPNCNAMVLVYWNTKPKEDNQPPGPGH